MLIKFNLRVLFAISLTFLGCSSNESKEPGTAVMSSSENKYSTSLKESAEKFSKAERDHDTGSFFPYLDTSFGVTARGQAHVVSGSRFPDFKKSIIDEFTDSTMITSTTYDIKNTEAGTNEPVWAGYDEGTFTQTTKSKDGKYDRKISGPYYRAWKLENGAWKCYQVVYMVFACEGNDCK